MDVNIPNQIIFFPEEESNTQEVFESTSSVLGNDFFIPMRLKQFQQNQILFLIIYLFFALLHSHKICTEILNYAYLESDGRLMKIDNWDFEHQEYYFSQI